jgi:hypothetical protein
MKVGYEVGVGIHSAPNYASASSDGRGAALARGHTGAVLEPRNHCLLVPTPLDGGVSKMSQGDSASTD